ncbi:MAG: hypothetical protein JO156_02680, partial [Solirubrobacterales bacterium]|nr:hypothetical protein [Solirubrobacterales bacterium]
MSDSELPLEIDRIESRPLGREKVLVRLIGKWRGRRRGAGGQELLVIESEGRRHRFPAIPESRRPRIGRPGAWSASFALPVWLEPQLSGQMSLWLGNSVIPVPPLRRPRGDSIEGTTLDRVVTLRPDTQEMAGAHPQPGGVHLSSGEVVDGTPEPPSH